MTTKSEQEAATRRLEELLDECCYEVAGMLADAEDNWLKTQQVALGIRAKLGKLGRMAGVELPEYRSERRVVKAS